MFNPNSSTGKKELPSLVPIAVLDKKQKEINTYTSILYKIDDLKAKLGDEYTEDNYEVKNKHNDLYRARERIFTLPGVKNYFNEPKDLPVGRNELDAVLNNVFFDYYSSNRSTNTNSQGDVIKVSVVQTDSNGNLVLEATADDNYTVKTTEVEIPVLGRSLEEITEKLTSMVESIVMPFQNRIDDLEERLSKIDIGGINTKLSNVMEGFTSISAKQNESNGKDPSTQMALDYYRGTASDLYDSFLKQHFDFLEGGKYRAKTYYGNMLMSTTTIASNTANGEYTPKEIQISEEFYSIFTGKLSDALLGEIDPKDGSRPGGWLHKDSRNRLGGYSKYQDKEAEFVDIVIGALKSTDLYIKSKYNNQFPNLATEFPINNLRNQNVKSPTASFIENIQQPGFLGEAAQGYRNKIPQSEFPADRGINPNEFNPTRNTPTLDKEHFDALFGK